MTDNSPVENLAETPVEGAETPPVSAENSPSAGETASAAETAGPALEAQLAEAQDQYRRCLAEMENLRKRQQRELTDMARYASMPLLRDLLPVMDNLHRATRAASQGGETHVLLDGVKMVLQQFENVLQQHGCQPIAAEQLPFDPNLHQAVTQLPSPTHPAGTVMHGVLRGFQLHDRVVHPSHVVVSSGEPPAC